MVAFVGVDAAVVFQQYRAADAVQRAQVPTAVEREIQLRDSGRAA